MRASIHHEVRLLAGDSHTSENWKPTVTLRRCRPSCSGAFRQDGCIGGDAHHTDEEDSLGRGVDHVIALSMIPCRRLPCRDVDGESGAGRSADCYDGRGILGPLELRGGIVERIDIRPSNNCTMKAQVKKVLEEAAELYSAYERFEERVEDSVDPWSQALDMRNEAMDVVVAAANTIRKLSDAGYLGDLQDELDVAAYRVNRDNRERGRIDG